jgi:hypothetical protein
MLLSISGGHHFCPVGCKLIEFGAAGEGLQACMDAFLIDQGE